MDAPIAVRLYVADSHPIWMEGMKAVVERRREIVVVGDALRWADALRDMPALAPDVAVIHDILAGSARAALDAVRARGVLARVLFLADLPDTATPYEAMANGAAGYVTRRIGPEHVVRAVLDVCAGGTAMTPDLQTRLAEEIRAREVGFKIRITPRERRTLQLIADGRTTTAIARVLGVSEATVKSDVAAIFGKLGVNDRAAAVAQAIRRGIVE